MTVKREVGIPFAFHVHSTEKGRTLGNGSEVVSNIELHAAKAADLIVTVSYAMKDELTQLGFPKERIQVCYNGVDEQKYNPGNVTSEQSSKIRSFYGIKDDEYAELVKML